MPKFNIEIDTDNKTSAIMVDGSPVDLSDVCFSYYKNGQDGFTASISHAIMGENEVRSKTYSFSTGSYPYSSQSETNYSVGREVSAVIKNAHASATLEKAFTNRKNQKN